jgi:spermidine/putrescine transport system permease protein
MYLQVRDGSTPVINAISFILILTSSMLAVVNLLFSKKED